MFWQAPKELNASNEIVSPPVAEKGPIGLMLLAWTLLSMTRRNLGSRGPDSQGMHPDEHGDPRTPGTPSRQADQAATCEALHNRRTPDLSSFPERTVSSTGIPEICV